MKCVLAILITLMGLAWANPSDNATARQEQVVAYLKKKAAEVTTNALAKVKSLEDWKGIESEQRRAYLYMLGLDPMPERTPLRDQITGVLEAPDYRVEKIVFQSSPKLFVTGNFYLPNKGARPLPTILYVCGHSPHPLGAKYHYQDRAQWFAEHGYACLIIDTLEFGEVAGIHHGLHNLNMWRWLSRGYTPAGVEVWNAMRAIDYLEARPEVDVTKIGVTGISGGGAVSWYTAATDERIAVAAPVCGTFTFGSQAAHWLADGQCDCIYFNNTYQTDLSMVGALIAPRPLLMCSGIRDSIFPPDGYHEVFRQTKAVYELHGAAIGKERILEVDDDVPHQDSPKLRQAARQWFNRWLKGDDSPVESVPNPDKKRHTAEELACLTEIPWDAANFGVHDHFVPLASSHDVDDLAKWTTRRKEILAEMHDKTFRWFPKQEIPFKPKPNGGHGGWLDRYGGYEDLQIQSEEATYIRVQIIKAQERSPSTPLLIYIKRPTDNLSHVDVDEVLPVLGHCDLAMINPRLTDHPIDHQEWTNIERTASWSGRTIAAMQVWDILRSIQFLKTNLKLATDDRRVVLFAKEGMAVPALYAALLDPDIAQLIVRNLPDSHQQAPPLLNVLRYTDIPEVAAMVAPREITFLGEPADGFALTKKVYELHSHPQAFAIAKSLAEALLLNR